MSNMPEIVILVATTRKCFIPPDSIYFPIQVGKVISSENLPYIGDDTGDNISGKNPVFCELTGFYWAWKNLNADYIGLVHYRRCFGTEKVSEKFNKNRYKRIIGRKELAAKLKKHPVVLPNKRHYFIETLQSHYAHTHYEEHIIIIRDVIARKCPCFISSFDRIMGKTCGHMFNLTVMRRDILDEYCKWLFDILFEAEKLINIEGLDDYQRRWAGRMGELMINVWIDYKLSSSELKQNDIGTLPVVYLDRVNIPKKVASFLEAKFFHKKYSGSF